MTRRRKILLAGIFFSGIILNSCSSSGQNTFPNLSLVDFSLEKIDRLLSEGENLRVIPLIYNRRKSNNDLGDRYERALSGLKIQWDEARQAGDWRAALRYQRSFSALGEDEYVGDSREQDFFLQGVEDYLKRDFSGAAAALAQQEINLDNLDPDKRENWADRFESLGHQSLANALRGEKNSPAPNKKDLVDGTVTVWVNRGIRLVGNIGIPDRGIGSGFFIDPKGYLLTNYHVIESEVDPSYQGYSRLSIKLDDESGERIPAQVIGWNKTFDLALLKTEMTVPYVFSLSDKKVPDLGEAIYAIGSPGGLTRTLTSGTVSAYSRSIQAMAGSLQIDVPINPGNSGGPLLNEGGEVIGIVFAGVSNFENINFAIPGEYVEILLPSLYEGGALELPWIGVSAWEYNKQLEISYLAPYSPAVDAGLQVGDIIQSIDGHAFKTIRAVQAYLIGRTPETILALEWKRDKLIHKNYVTLATRPDLPLLEAMTHDARENLLPPLFGITVERINGIGFYQNYRIKRVQLGSVADESGFSSGDSFSLRKWIHHDEYDAVAIQLIFKGRKAGFLESAIQIGAYLNVDTIF